MKNRVDIKNFILSIETDFPVNNWKINGVHLWPILRIRLFFYLINHVENKENKNKKPIEKTKSPLQILKSRLREVLYVFHYITFLILLPKKKIIFVGTNAHRVNHNGARYNRYFDVLIEKYRLENQYLYFEYGDQYANQFNKKKVFKFKKALFGHLRLYKHKKNHEFCFNEFDTFIHFLESNEIFKEYIVSNNQEQLIQWFEVILKPKVVFFTKVLRRVNPDKIIILCYYSEDILALVLAANDMGIKTVEMQHGPQTEIHLCYGNWSKIPKEGYSFLPRNFWSWDESSCVVLEKWVSKNDMYSVNVVGNPWVEYWKLKKINYEYDNFILYSLQPNPLSLEQMFTENIIKLIKNGGYLWFVRLHPRQLHQKAFIVDFFEKKGVINLINYESATNDPLPLLLSKALVHVTHFSGSTIEASEMGVKSILLNESGNVSYADFINDGKAFYIDYKDNEFEEKFLETIKIIQKTPKKPIFVTNQFDNIFE